MEVIYVKFSFLKKRSILLIVALTTVIITNIKDVIINRAMDIDRSIKNKK